MYGSVTSVYQKFNKPVWLTEFGASGSDEQQAAFLNVMVPWLNQQKFVARYAYFSDIAGEFAP
jgi:beta-mannanase